MWPNTYFFHTYMLKALQSKIRCFHCSLVEVLFTQNGICQEYFLKLINISRGICFLKKIYLTTTVEYWQKYLTCIDQITKRNLTTVNKTIFFARSYIYVYCAHSIEEKISYLFLMLILRLSANVVCVYSCAMFWTVSSFISQIIAFLPIIIHFRFPSMRAY